jgi:hypothetical protein
VTPDEHTESMAAELGPRLEVSVGHEAFEPGWTQVVLDARGGVQVVCRLEGSDPRRAEAKLDAERAAEMIRTAEDQIAGAREGKRQGLPDEPRYHFEIRDGERRQSFDLWRSELREHPELERIVAALQEVLAERTRGEILL